MRDTNLDRFFVRESTYSKKINVCSEEKYRKHSSVLLLRLVYFSAEQTLLVVEN